ncbi:MAG TPA: alpha/beta hydrolase [Blastocatellia bacterium]
MKGKLRLLFLLSVPAVTGFAVRALAQVRASAPGLGGEFASQTVTLNGTRLHFVRGGKGPALILIHGFPQDWFEYNTIMPRLAKQFTVIAVDLRGVGESTPASGGFDAANMAEDIHQLATLLRLGPVYIVGHDIGGMVAYAFVRQYPEITRRVMILDVPLPGIAGWDEVQADPNVWHVRFMQVPGFAEKLVTGRQADYFEYFFQFAKFTPSEKAHFVKAYGTTAQLHAAFEMYRAFPANAEFNAAERGAINVPILYATGDGSPFARIVTKVANGLRANGCTHVETAFVRGAVHYLVEDQPDEVAELIEQFGMR